MPKQPTKPVDARTQRYRNNSNAVRKARYATDAAYRKECQERAVRFKLENSATPRKNCRDNLAGNPCKLWSIGKARLIGVPKGQDPGPLQLTFSYQEVAIAVGDFTEICLRRWIREGFFPNAIYHEHRGAANTGPSRHLYTEAQVRGFIDVLSVHQETKRKLRKQDTEVIAALFRCIQLT